MTEGDNRAILAARLTQRPLPDTENTIHKNNHKQLVCNIVNTSSIMSNLNDAIQDLLDSLPRQTTPLFQPKGGARYRFGWDDDSKKSDWRADG